MAYGFFMRKDAREAVFKIIYAYNFTGEFDEDLITQTFDDCNLSSEDKTFATRLLDTIKEHYDEITGGISDLAVNYMLERVYSTDKCALILGIAEMKFFDDVPNIVAIDEALSLCKKYSTEKSLGFVNGIFAKYKTMIESPESQTV